jgi:DNA-binding transcriptional LysR family regulator
LTGEAAMADRRDLDREIRALGRFDLNLLVVFHALAQTGHVGHAAKALGVSQPAVSHALKRLRGMLDDQLFVRSPRGILPTPRALKLAPAVERLLRQVRTDVFSAEAFSPAALERTFTIRMTGLTELLLLPPLLTRLATEAPGVRIASKLSSPEFPQEDLERGVCDLAIAGFFERVPPAFKRQVVLQDGFLAAVRAGHPRLKRKADATLAAYCAERHLLIAPGGELEGQVDRELRKKKLTRHVAGGVGDFVGAGWIMASTDLVLTAPATLIHHVAAHTELMTFAPPVKLGSIVIAQIWHERQQDDPAHVWLRELCASILREQEVSA